MGGAFLHFGEILHLEGFFANEESGQPDWYFVGVGAIKNKVDEKFEGNWRYGQN